METEELQGVVREGDAFYDEETDALGMVVEDGGGAVSEEEPSAIDVLTASSYEIGLLGETLAARHLVSRGVAVLDDRWHCYAGEADLVCQDESGTIILVEVKTRRCLEGRPPESYPEDAVDEAKRRRYDGIARCFLAAHPDVEAVRFDVVAVEIVAEHCAHVHWLPNAFGSDL